MSSNPVDVKKLLEEAALDGDLSAESLATLTVDADIGARIQAGMGVAPDDVPASEVVLVSLMPDDSGSIRYAGNAGAVREGHNLVLRALRQSKQGASTLVHTRYLNGFVLCPYRPLADAVEMTSKNYDPNLGTPLYDEMAVLLGTVLAKTREFEMAGVPVRSVTLVISDGADAGSVRQTPASLRPLVEDLRRKETHVVAAMGIEDGSTDFHRVFREVGIPDEWILTASSNASDIRRAFQVFSQSAVKVSQGAGLGAFIN